jgi:hypothetical protein
MMVMEAAQRHDEGYLKIFALPSTNPVPFSSGAVDRRSSLEDVPSPRVFPGFCGYTSNLEVQFTTHSSVVLPFLHSC